MKRRMTKMTKMTNRRLACALFAPPSCGYFWWCTDRLCARTRTPFLLKTNFLHTQRSSLLDFGVYLGGGGGGVC